ncbi:hypothetical protein [Kaistella sp.]|uniref:hypothetical protein n=1 Tax=Kaistella sp. TaxID=2782235 RepID=UPI002F92D14E
MRIVIAATPEYSPTEFTEVLQILNEMSGPVTFIDGGIIDGRSMKILFKEYDEKSYLSFEDIWGILGDYRHINKINEKDYVALLTPKKNNLNWFSAFSGKDLFVDTNDWDMYTQKESKYGIAFSIVENIIQSLMNLNVNDLSAEPNIHYEKSIGCINDFCGNKSDIMFKLRNAYICDSCKKRIRTEKLDITIATHLIQLIEFIRNKMVNNFSWLEEVEPERVTVCNDGTLKIGEKAINLTTQIKSIYFLFLNNPNGIVTSALADYRNEGAQLYYLLRYPQKEIKSKNQVVIGEQSTNLKNVDKIKMDEITNSIAKILDNVETQRFREGRCKINKEITTVMGLKMSEFYIIENWKGDSNLYKVKVEKESISIDPKYVI